MVSEDWWLAGWMVGWNEGREGPEIDMEGAGTSVFELGDGSMSSVGGEAGRDGHKEDMDNPRNKRMFM